MDDSVFGECPPYVAEVPPEKARLDVADVKFVVGLGDIYAAFLTTMDGEVDLDQLVLVIDMVTVTSADTVPKLVKVAFMPDMLDELAQLVLTSVNPMADAIANADPEKLTAFINKRRSGGR